MLTLSSVQSSFTCNPVRNRPIIHKCRVQSLSETALHVYNDCATSHRCLIGVPLRLPLLSSSPPPPPLLLLLLQLNQCAPRRVRARARDYAPVVIAAAPLSSIDQPASAVVHCLDACLLPNFEPL